jgi:hypothetical protein
VWSDIYGTRKDLKFKEAKGDEKLFSALFELDDKRFKGEKTSADLKSEIRAVIDSHLGTDEVGVQTK